jgi:hypothetical protein
MNPANLHLILNHVPILGTAAGFLLLAWAAMGRNAEVRRLGFLVLVLAAVAALPVYLSGEPAEQAVEHLPGVTESRIERHEDSAKRSFALIEGLGAVSLAGLFIGRRRRIPTWLAVTTLVLSLFTAVQVGWTGHLGGQIRHSEIRSGAPSDGQQVGARDADEPDDD